MLSVSLTRQVEDTLERTADDILRASQVSIGGIPLSSIQLESSNLILLPMFLSRFLIARENFFDKR